MDLELDENQRAIADLALQILRDSLTRERLRAIEATPERLAADEWRKLAAAGLLNAPLASGPLMSWGQAGKGKWVTIYANAGHVYLVVAGVRFMGETAKILNPSRTVLLPNLLAGCQLADSAPAEELQARIAELKLQFPDLAVVSYVNTTAAVKAL